MQLHGDEDNAYMEAVVRGLSTQEHEKGEMLWGPAFEWVDGCAVCCVLQAKPVMKVVHVPEGTTVDMVMEHPAMAEGGRAIAVLLDTKVGGSAAGGTGKTFDWGVATAIQSAGLPLFVAGGETLSFTSLPISD